MSRGRLSQSISYAAVAAAQCLAAMLLHSAPSVCAQQLSVRRYDVSDGLAHSHVGAIHQDAKGYLWFGTREGLSRFDGYRFTNYGTREGLGNMIINAIVEDRQGQLWVATNGGGVARLIGSAAIRFRASSRIARAECWSPIRAMSLNSSRRPRRGAVDDGRGVP